MKPAAYRSYIYIAVSDTYELKIYMSMAEIPAEEWNRLALQLDTPLLEWEWLNAFEVSGSMSPETGWLPVHFTLWRDGSLKAAAPLYVKSHSQGEFIFDYMWADVAEQLDIRYYPKLVGMSPATPVSGYRFLSDPGEDGPLLTRAILERIDRFCTQNKLSGCSFNFTDTAWTETVTELGYSVWKHQGYIWENPGFSSFDDYIARFTKNQRRNIRRERKSLADQGIVIVPHPGDDMPDRVRDIIFRYYVNTNDQFGPWGAKYLNEDFFRNVLDTFGRRIVVFAAYEGSNPVPVGMSFCLVKNGSMLGRYWGAERWIDTLHFNACYYAPIEWAIANGIRYFDPGMGSSHKVRRGFLSVPNFSLHRFSDPRMRLIMDRNMDTINGMEQGHIDELNAALPLAGRDS